jgi:hypothetical protein
VSPVRYKLASYIPEDGILHSHRRESLKYNKAVHAAHRRFVVRSLEVTAAVGTCSRPNGDHFSTHTHTHTEPTCTCIRKLSPLLSLNAYKEAPACVGRRYLMHPAWQRCQCGLRHRPFTILHLYSLFKPPRTDMSPCDVFPPGS